MSVNPTSNSASVVSIPYKNCWVPPHAPNRDSLKSYEVERAARNSKLFFEDLGGFLANLFLWPLLGHQVLMYQLIFAICIPFLLPIILVAEFYRILVDIFTCGCLKEALYGPQFKISEPNSTDRHNLLPLIKQWGSHHLDTEQQIRLTHLMNTYFNFADRYSTDKMGKSHQHFQAVIKVNIDGKTCLFQYKPNTNHAEVLKTYLRFIRENATPKSSVKHTFVGLDYTYFIGMLNMKVKTDTVEVSMKKEEEEYFCCGPLIRTFFPSLEKKHREEIPLHESSFAMWPGNTRNFVCQLINRKLKSNDLQDYQISLIDLESVVKF